MLPVPPNFFTGGQQLPGFSLENTFATGPLYGPHPQLISLRIRYTKAPTQTLQKCLRTTFVLFISKFWNCRCSLGGFYLPSSWAQQKNSQNAYEPGNSLAQTEGTSSIPGYASFALNITPQADILHLKQLIADASEKLRQSGVGALPLIPPPTDPSAAPVVPTEAQLLASTRSSLLAVYEKLQRSQDGASVVANLLTTDHQPRAGK